MAHFIREEVLRKIVLNRIFAVTAMFYEDITQDNYHCARYKGNTGDCMAHFIREEVLRKIVLNRIFAVTAMFYEDITAFMELIQKQRFDEAEKDMAHFIREEVLRKIVLNRIFAVTAMFYEDITAFMELIQKQRFDEAEKDMKRKRREVGQAKKRIAELDRIFKRIYEDDINGTISHERFLKLSAECEAEHFIREEVLRKIVLNRIFAVTAMFYEDITAFMELIQKQRFDEAEKDMKRKRREVGQAKKRIAELDRIFKRIYEDDINGTISHERFLKLSAECEAEQKELTEKVQAEQQELDTYEQNKSDFDSFNGTISHERFLKLSAECEAEQKELTEKVQAEQQELDTYEQNKSDFDSFAAIIRKYVGITELTPTIVNEFVKKIIVHAPEKIDGKRFQKVDIVFNFVGEIHLPTDPQTNRNTIVNEFVKKIIVHAPEKIDGKRFQKVDIVFNFVGEIHLPTDPQTNRKKPINKKRRHNP